MIRLLVDEDFRGPIIDGLLLLEPNLEQMETEFRTAKWRIRMKTIHEQYVFDTKGKKTGVILSLERYEQLLEDLHDLAVVAERRDEKPVSFEEMKKRLKKDGIL